MHSAATRSPQPHRACGACGATRSTVCHHQRFIVPEGYPLPQSTTWSSASAVASFMPTPPPPSATTTGSTASGPSTTTRRRRPAAEFRRTTPLDSRSLPPILPVHCLRAPPRFSMPGARPEACLRPCPNRVSPPSPDLILRLTAPPPAVNAAFRLTSARLPRLRVTCRNSIVSCSATCSRHVYDIPAFFAAARGSFAPGGYLYLETPDATRYEDYLYAPFQEFNTEHLNHFSPQSLKNTARHLGFSR